MFKITRLCVLISLSEISLNIEERYFKPPIKCVRAIYTIILNCNKYYYFKDLYSRMKNAASVT